MIKHFMRSSLNELNILHELKQLKELKKQLESSASKAPTYNVPMKIVPGTVIFQSTDDMKTMSGTCPVGSIAYIINEQALLVRVDNGWRFISLSQSTAMVKSSHTDTAASPSPAIIVPPPITTPFEASNLMNQKPSTPTELANNGTSLRVAALNEPYSGDMHGIRGADHTCNRQARRSGFRGSFRAFLSSRVQNVDSIVRVSDRDLPIVNIKGEVLFDSWRDIFTDKGTFATKTPTLYSFNGKNIMTDSSWPEKFIWHGWHSPDQPIMDTYCEAWFSQSSDRYSFASSLTNNRILEQQRYSCDRKFALLCMEVTSEPVSSPPHSDSKRKRRSTLRKDVAVHSAELD